MKQLALLVLLCCSMAAGSTPTDEILQHFTSSFPSATEVRWYDEEFGYEARFKRDRIECRVQYDKKGNLVKSTRFYYAQDLVPFIQARVKEAYPKQQIYGVTEVQTEEELKFYIVLQDEKRWYDIEVTSNGETRLTKKFFKALQN